MTACLQEIINRISPLTMFMSKKKNEGFVTCYENETSKDMVTAEGSTENTTTECHTRPVPAESFSVLEHCVDDIVLFLPRNAL